jgi:hypothetical protein
MKRIFLSMALALGIAGTVGASWALLSTSDESGQQSGISASLGRTDPRHEDVEGYELRNDPRVRAFVQAYEPLIDSVMYGEDDVVFALGSQPIHFQDGRMLEAGRLDRGEDCDPIFYRYSIEPLTEPLPLPEETPTYCTDVLESLWGRTDAQIREHGGSTTFLDHRMFVNELVVDALAAVEKDILQAATDERSVATWIDELDITYSFANRGIAGSPTRSNHAWGMAVDFVPNSYERLDVYWRWSRVFDREEWHQIPLEQRWSPPQTVVEIFERHGFVWGGKWAHFDTIHFEYRPEILLYNRLISE